MASLVVEGGNRLVGTVRVSGRKNSAVAVLPATLLTEEPCILENIPYIEDARVYMDILRHIGAAVERDDSGAIMVDARRARRLAPPRELVKRLRSSYYLLGAMLGRFGRAEVAFPGGCEIGSRPIDQHIKGFTALGAEVVIEHGMIRAQADRLTGATIYLDVTSVGATINIILAACRAEGTTVIENAAKESHVVDLANCLNSMGARIVGAGTDVIKIRGVDRLGHTTHAIIPDEIEAATYLIAAVGSRGLVRVDNVIPKHLDPVVAKLREAGADIEENGDSIVVRMDSRPKAVSIKTLPYPGFPTDAQQPMTALLATAEGTSLVTESIWESRFRHIEELNRMGARIRAEGRTAIIEGVQSLSGAPVSATDLRAGAALVVAGLIATGRTEISEIEHVYRGYEHLEGKLSALGARLNAQVDSTVLKSGGSWVQEFPTMT